jgi:hypothetical protein
MTYVAQYEEQRNAHYLGRGSVFFTPPLLPSGGVNTAAYGLLWGDNWPPGPDVSGLHLPAGRFVGNARTLSVQPTLRKLTTSAWDARGNTLVESAQASLTLYGHGAANLADALHGLRSQRHAVQPTTERVDTGSAGIDAGGMLFTRGLVNTAKPVNVSPSWAVWQEGVQWQRTACGVQLLAGVSGPPGSYVHISYTPEGGAQSVDALGNLDMELGIVYAGINAVDGRPLRMQLYRARPALDGALAPLADGIGAITLNFSIEPVRVSTDRPAEWLRITRGQYPEG